MREKVPLTLEEWQRIFVMQSWGKRSQEISNILKRDRRTVERALKRYPVPWYMKVGGPYDKAKYSYEQAKLQRSKPRRKQRLKNQFIQTYVEEKLILGWSPELIAGRLSREHPEFSISYEAIYEWIFIERKDLKQYLLRAGQSKRGRPGARAYQKREPAAPKRSIEDRPGNANNRTEIGHKESDLVVSSKSDVCLLVVVDRKSRQVRLRKLPNRKAETVKAALVALFVILPSEQLVTLTQDNGSEHALHAELEKVTGVQVFFCHPYAAYERGTIENRNGLVRRYFPKGTDFENVTDEQVARVEAIINSKPMVVLNFMTPDEFHQIEVQAINERLAA